LTIRHNSEQINQSPADRTLSGQRATRRGPNHQATSMKTPAMRIRGVRRIEAACRLSAKRRHDGGLSTAQVGPNERARRDSRECWHRMNRRCACRLGLPLSGEATAKCPASAEEARHGSHRMGFRHRSRRRGVALRERRGDQCVRRRSSVLSRWPVTRSVVGACRASRKLREYRNKIRVCADSLETPADQTATELEMER